MGHKKLNCNFDINTKGDYLKHLPLYDQIILIGICRKKDNENIEEFKQITFKEYVKKSHLGDLIFEQCFKKLLSIIQARPEKFRIYMTFNKRNEKQAYKEFKKRLINLDDRVFNGELLENISDIKNIWLSCLQKHKQKEGFFMLDLDNKEELTKLENILEELKIRKEIHETINGYHLLFQAQDTRKLIEEIKKQNINCELKRDDLLLIAWED